MLSEILQRLDKVKQHGDQYYACCPVHDDKSPSMGITEKEGKVLIHCFSCGATGQEVMEAIGLPVSALFRDKKRGDIPNKIIEKAKEDVWYIEVFENEKRKGTRITYNEWKRYRLAKERVKILEER